MTSKEHYLWIIYIGISATVKPESVLSFIFVCGKETARCIFRAARALSPTDRNGITKMW